jgi:hypothetical protein
LHGDGHAFCRMKALESDSPAKLHHIPTPRTFDTLQGFPHAHGMHSCLESIGQSRSRLASCHAAKACHAMAWHVMPCHAMPCHAMPCRNCAGERSGRGAVTCPPQRAARTSDVCGTERKWRMCCGAASRSCRAPCCTTLGHSASCSVRDAPPSISSSQLLQRPLAWSHCSHCMLAGAESSSATSSCAAPAAVPSRAGQRPTRHRTTRCGSAACAGRRGATRTQAALLPCTPGSALLLPELSLCAPPAWAAPPNVALSTARSSSQPGPFSTRASHSGFQLLGSVHMSRAEGPLSGT